MTRPIMVLNGPNLNLLGEREPAIYGHTTLADIEAACRDLCGLIGREVRFHQSNHEGVLIDWIQEARRECDALVINPAGLSFGSVPLVDALRMFEGPLIEVHISNIHARDELHRHSTVSANVTGVICGLGPYGYLAGILAACRHLGPLPGLPTPLADCPT